MEAEQTVLDLLGLITRSFTVGSVSDGEPVVSSIPVVLQTENGIASLSTVATTGGNPTNGRADVASLLNIQRLVGQIGDIENIVESVETDLQIQGSIPPSLPDNKIGDDSPFEKQTLQTVEKTDNLVEDDVVFTPTSRLLTSNANRKCDVLDGVSLYGQGSDGNVTAIADGRGQISSQESLIGDNSLASHNSTVQNSLPTFLSSQSDSVDKYCTLLPKESNMNSCLRINGCEQPASSTLDSNTGTLPFTQVAHIAYCIHDSPLNRGQTYAMRKHKMVDLILSPYMCSICGDIFNSTSKLGQHVVNSHSYEMMEDSEIAGNNGGNSNLQTVQRHASKGETPTITAAVHEGKDIEDRFLEHLVQSSIPVQLSKTYKGPQTTTVDGDEHRENHEDESSVGKNKRRNRTGDGDRKHKGLKIGRECHNAEESMHRLCQRSEDAHRVEGLKGEVRENEGSVKLKTKSGKVFKCEFCEDVFTSNKYRYKHRVTCHPHALFECPVCVKSYTVTEKDKWQHHIRIHNKPPPKPKPDSYNCDLCSIVFRAANAVAIHMQTFHPETDQGEKRFCCEICGKLFRTRNALKSHQTLVHSDDTPYQCGTCSRKFKKESYLKLHRRTHTGEKPFMCKFCNKAFPSTTGRRSHERTHTNERPYKCSYCGNSFRAKPQMVEHERTHTQERPFACTLCGKSFGSRTSLKTHQFLHTGKKPYKCESCSRCFAQKSNLTDHIRSIHSQEKPYECTICCAKFTRSTSRKVHMEKKHGLKITVRQGRPPIHESNQAVDSIIATCLSIDVGSVLTPTEDASLVFIADIDVSSM